jgi:prepilin-type N-terminal cleavage/methylation domain-containing protein
MKLRGAVSDNKSRKGKVESGNNCALRISLTPDLWPLTPSRGMTLIELLVVIVILTTLVGGVLPLVSPNNDTRKISEGVRSLQTYFMQAQAEAARIGRPVGIGFRETSAGSGVALEVFQLTVPKPYYGSSSLSRVGLAALKTGTPGEEVPQLYRGTRYPSYVGSQLYGIDSRLALRNDGELVVDPLPPKMFRIGDTLIAQGNRFVIIDDERCKPAMDINTGNWFINPSTNSQGWENVLFCVRLDEVQMQDEAQPLAPPPTGYSYAIHRQPMADSATRMTSSASTLQLPSSISIDLWATGIEVREIGNIGDEPLLDDPTDFTIPIDKLPYTVGLMFSPNGGIESVWINGKKSTELSKMFFLIGRQENGNPPSELYTDWGGKGQAREMTAEELKDRRSKVNWLNMDSKWLVVNAIDGRISVSANASFDPLDRVIQDDTTAYVERRFGELTTDQIDKRGGAVAVRAQFTRDYQIGLAHGLSHGHVH